jgi:hypothetical protein
MSIERKFIKRIKLSALEKAAILKVHKFGRKLPKAEDWLQCSERLFNWRFRPKATGRDTPN